MTPFKVLLLSGPFPCTIKGAPLYVPTISSFVFRSTATKSKTLFFGLHSAIGSPTNPSQVTRSPTTEPAGGIMSSTFSGVLAQRTIASDWTPLSLHGLRLHSKTTICFRCKTIQSIIKIAPYFISVYLLLQSEYV